MYLGHYRATFGEGLVMENTISTAPERPDMALVSASWVLRRISPELSYTL
jgi:hypothetical protein